RSKPLPLSRDDGEDVGGEGGDVGGGSDGDVGGMVCAKLTLCQATPSSAMRMRMYASSFCGGGGGGPSETVAVSNPPFVFVRRKSCSKVALQSISTVIGVGCSASACSSAHVCLASPQVRP